MATKTIYPKVHLTSLLMSAAKDCKSFEIALGFDWADKALNQIAEYAIAKNDAILIEHLHFLGYIDPSEGETDDDIRAKAELARKEMDV